MHQSLSQKESSVCEEASSSFVKTGLKLKDKLKIYLHILKILKSVPNTALLQIIVAETFCGVCAIDSNSKLSIFSFNFPSF